MVDKKQKVVIEEIKPDKFSVNIVDLSSGESIKEVTSNGRTVRTFRGSRTRGARARRILRERAEQEKRRIELERIQAAKVAQEAAQKKAAIEQEKARQIALVRKTEVEKFRSQILSKGADTRSKILRDVDTGRDVRITTVGRSTGERIFTKEDLSTGKKTTRVFERVRKKKGRPFIGPIRETSGIEEIINPKKLEKERGIESEKEISQRSEVQPFEPQEKTFLGSVREKVSSFRGKVQTKKLRGKKVTLVEEFGAGVGAGAAISLIGTAQVVKGLVTEPIKTVSGIASGTKSTAKRFARGEGFPEIGRVIREEPGFAAGFLAAEIATAGAAGKALSKTAGVGEAAFTRASPNFRKVASEDKVTKIKDVPSAIPDQKPTDIPLVKSFRDITEPVKTQARLSGKTVDAVSAQRGLFSLTKKEVVVDKPKPTPDAPELERAFFADPRGRARASRLGLEEQQTAGLIDILSGDVTFRRARPQLVTVEKTPVERFPKRLRNIESKLKKGKPLTPSEQAKLTEFQLTPSGKFKPVGFISTEPEIVLAPGEVLRKKKTRAVTLVGGRRVPIIGAEIAQRSQDIDRVGRIRAPKEDLLLKKAISDSSPPSTRPRIRKSSVPSIVPSLSKAVKASPIARGRISRAGKTSPTPAKSPAPRIFPSLSKITRQQTPRRKAGSALSPPTSLRRIATRPPKPPLKPRFSDEDLLKEVKKRKKDSLREAAFFTPGFIEKVFDIRRKITKKEAREIALSGDPFRRRPIPIFK